MSGLTSFFGDPKTAEAFYRLIENIVDKKMEKAQFDKSYPGVVTAVVGNYADVRLMGSATSVTHIKNKSGETLTVGDSVVVLAERNNLNHLKITDKKEVI